MPDHYKSNSKPMPEKVKKMLRAKKDTGSKTSQAKREADPSGSSEKSIKGFRKMTDREKKLLAQHFEKNPHDKSQKAKMRSAVMKRGEIKSMKGLDKLHKEIFG